MPEDRLSYLFRQYFDNKATASEQEEFLLLMDDEQNSVALNTLMDEALKNGYAPEELDNETSRIVLASIFAAGKNEIATRAPARRTAIHFIKRFRWVAAAVFIMAIAATWLVQNNKPASRLQADPYKNDIPPGMMGAIIELSNGKKILLDTAGNGILASLGLDNISKDKDGVKISSGSDARVQYITVTTPLKRTQKIELSDGSTIWLNAGSSVKFPTRFTGHVRMVEVTGQIIAKVVYNESNPFRVSARGQVFEDKGTEFDVNAYDDEPIIRITVLEGAVAFKNLNARAGQQINTNAKGADAIVNGLTDAKMDEVFAWRDEQFTYDHASIETILKQAAKWYDVQIVYEGNIKQQFTLIGVGRKTPISTLLKSMELSGGVHFEVQGRKVIVKP